MSDRVYAPITRENLEVVREEILKSFRTLADERGHTLSDNDLEACYSTLVEVLQHHHLDFLEYACVAVDDGGLLDWNPLYHTLRTAYERHQWRKAFSPVDAERDVIPFNWEVIPALSGKSSSSLDDDYEDH